MGRASRVEIGDGRAASGVVVVVVVVVVVLVIGGGGEVVVSVRFATVARLRAVAVLLSPRSGPLHGGMTKIRDLAGDAPVADVAAAAAAAAAVGGDTTVLGETGSGVGRGVPDDGRGVCTGAGAPVAAAVIAIPCPWRLPGSPQKTVDINAAVAQGAAGVADR